MLELKQQVLSGALSDATETQASVATLLGALQGLCALTVDDNVLYFV